tara:strand:- start:438 stop:848 length:411 start_codon:yes stop_codon:yes gene_type:complete
MSISKSIIPILIEISAILKMGKFIGNNSRKSLTKPSLNLSIPLPKVPPKIKANPIPFHILIGSVFHNNKMIEMATIRLIKLRKVVLPLNKLNAAPVFLTSRNCSKWGIAIIDLLADRLLKAQDFVTWSINVIRVAV